MRLVALLLLSLGLQSAPAVEPGFVSLFNGKDFAGWYGVPHYDPRKLAALSEEDRKKQIDSWMMDTLAHWLKTLTGMPAVAMSPAAGAQQGLASFPAGCASANVGMLSSERKCSHAMPCGSVIQCFSLRV